MFPTSVPFSKREIPHITSFSAQIYAKYLAGCRRIANMAAAVSPTYLHRQ
jgi:hypothetical protein